MAEEAYINSGTDRQRVWWRMRGIFLDISLVGRLDAYVARFPVGTPPLPFGSGGGSGGAA